MARFTRFVCRNTPYYEDLKCLQIIYRFNALLIRDPVKFLWNLTKLSRTQNKKQSLKNHSKWGEQRKKKKR